MKKLIPDQELIIHFHSEERNFHKKWLRRIKEVLMTLIQLFEMFQICDILGLSKGRRI